MTIDAATENPPRVLVVGAGPVGLTVASLLAARDVPVLVVERKPTTSDEAKAISIDDESLRTFASAGLAETVLKIVVPGTGTRYFDRRGRPLFHAGGPTPVHRRGFPFKNQFAQPELEAALLAALTGRSGVEVRFGTELVAYAGQPDGTVSVSLRDIGSDRITTEPVSWVLGCDGGRSTVRELAGITMTGAGHDEVWLVVDTVGDHHRERYGMHHGDPLRPTVVVPGRDGRCRYEFLQHPGEIARDERPAFDAVRRLVSPYRAITEDQIERCTAYTFNAVVADTWRAGRVFLLGDAAHMMPPFAGQGLNSGIRDAANLAWKLAGVLHGEFGERLLDTYESERKPHAVETVRYSERLGRIVMTTSRVRATVRDLVVRSVRLTARGRRYLSEMRFRPVAVHTDGVVAGRPHALTGREVPQPLVLVPPGLRPQRADTVLGDGFAILGVAVTPTAWRHVLAAFEGRLRAVAVDVVLGDRLPQPTPEYMSVADADGALEAALSEAEGHFLVVRPDRHVAAVFTADEAAGTALRLADRLDRAATVPPVLTKKSTSAGRATADG
ncbi:bifunctional 3-(3-hydroxy-phenyl)propionate/3-hydroxycinnamic acid hydroxylase [Streptomyces sp. NPDC102415]|uniref:bifunctional 3-(3-hydroxy-phenyl)propionate/3-hydroxycinnamic acid hydroxylase n=1 Tax=Streptomyces sp. NPDC102415 TaxID=3366173 RepID=UPI00381C0933